MKKFDSNHIFKILSLAKKEVLIIGVVPLEIEWDDLLNIWADTSNANPSFSATILCESDNFLFAKSFITDTEHATPRVSFKEMAFRRDQVIGRADTRIADNIRILQFHLPIPICAIRIDGELIYSPWLHALPTTYIECGSEDPWSSLISSYADVAIDQKQGLKYSSKHGDEILELFDHSRTPRGIYPRASFYDTDYSQLVVWALVFDRDGRLLIHRRDKNAKDNDSMWDKSVGGHIDFQNDVDSSRAVLREVIEELFTDELKEQDIRTWDITDRDMIYMGEWRPKQRRSAPLEEIRSYTTEWAFFRLKDSQHLYSPRHMPLRHGGGIRRLRVIADVYLFVAGRSLKDESLGKLENSKYKLIELSDLKTVMDRAMSQQSVEGFEDGDDAREIPLFSPDLTNIMTGSLRDVLEEFSLHVKKYISGRKP